MHICATDAKVCKDGWPGRGRGPDITSFFQKKASGLPLRQSVRPFLGCSSSGGGSRRRSARNRESTARRQLGQIWRSAALGSIPPDASQREAKGAAAGGGGPQAEKYRVWSRRPGGGEDAGTKGIPQTWTRQTILEEEAGISCARAALSANISWSRTDAAASLQHLQKNAEGGLSVETLGVHVLRAVVARASPLGDWVREVLRTSFTTVEASGNSVRQRDLLPLPVPWSWAPFAEFFGRPSKSGGIAAAIMSDAEGVSCTVWGAGPCW